MGKLADNSPKDNKFATGVKIGMTHNLKVTRILLFWVNSVLKSLL